MPAIERMDPDARQDLVERLKRIEGQARGIRKMIDDGRDCEQIVNQVAAMKAASHALSGRMLEAWALYCIDNPDDFPSREKAVSEMVRVVMNAGRA
jgi:DNA-binding FrmR family transcriptional regulator